MIEVLYFSAPWCAPCRAMKPVFEKTESKLPDVKFTKVDIDESPEKANEFGVSSVPTVIIVRDGDPVARAGVMAPAAFERWIVSNA